jgi:hypothetical protein
VCVKNIIFLDVTLCNVLEIYERFAKEHYCHLKIGRMFVRKVAKSRKSTLLYYFSATCGSKTTTTTTTADNDRVKFQQWPQVTLLITPWKNMKAWK